MLKANERRQKILEILCVRRQETMENLAQESERGGRGFGGQDKKKGGFQKKQPQQQQYGGGKERDCKEGQEKERKSHCFHDLFFLEKFYFSSLT